MGHSPTIQEQAHVRTFLTKYFSDSFSLEVTPTTTLADIGVDSLDVMELVMAVEAELEIDTFDSIPEDVLIGSCTVEEAVIFFANHLEGPML